MLDEFYLSLYQHESECKVILICIIILVFNACNKKIVLMAILKTRLYMWWHNLMYLIVVTNIRDSLCTSRTFHIVLPYWSLMSLNSWYTWTWSKCWFDNWANWIENDQLIRMMLAISKLNTRHLCKMLTFVLFSLESSTCVCITVLW